MSAHKNFPGEKFSRLKILAREKDYALCLCDCGNEKRVRMDKLKEGTTKSCGCLAAELAQANKKPSVPKVRKLRAVAPAKPVEHVKLRAVWATMRARTCDPRSTDYPTYGGRGIGCCPEWENFEAFLAWALQGYRIGLYLERDNNLLGYSPANCSWATPWEQSINRRNTRWVIGDRGELVPLATVVLDHKLDYMRTYMRYRRLVDKGIEPTERLLVDKP
jgi:hypothetical protein